MKFRLDPEIDEYMNKHDVDEFEAANALEIPLSDMYDRVDEDDDY